MITSFQIFEGFGDIFNKKSHFKYKLGVRAITSLNILLVESKIYGTIIDMGEMGIRKFYLLETKMNISEDQSETLKNVFINNMSLIKRMYNTELKRQNVRGTWIGSECNYIWVPEENIRVYYKEDYDKLVEEIEMERNMKKYNL